MGVTPPRPVFVFGTLRDPQLLETVAGGAVRAEPAQLPGARVARADGQSFPLLADAPDQQAEGILLEVSPHQRDRLDFYEAPYAYTRQEAQVMVGGQMRGADVYKPHQADWTPAEDWSLAQWQIAHGPLAREAAVEIMDGFGQLAPQVIAQRTPVIHARAQQRLNARAATTPVALRSARDRQDATLVERSRAYSHFFALDDVTLRFRTFAGAMSAPVERAVLISADAVTVLPYDPVRDVVLLIDQFRAGPYLRGDPHPWSLEAIAGRHDPGESFEDTARREAMEEAGIAMGALHKVTSYYPSPGIMTEYLTSYIGITDLPEDAAGLGGLADEAEDIRSMVVPFDRLMRAVEDGEAENGPLILSALWLAANRDRLRG